MRSADLPEYLVKAALYRVEVVDDARPERYQTTGGRYWLPAPSVVDRECRTCGDTKWQLTGADYTGRIWSDRSASARATACLHVLFVRVAPWTAQQIADAFPDDSAPAYLLPDRDTVYGDAFRHRVTSMGIREVLTAPSCPWQNPFAERLIASIRRDCLDQVLVLNERHLRRILTRYFAYYHRPRTHLSLETDAPDRRPIERPEMGRIVPMPEVGGRHHRDARQAA